MPEQEKERKTQYEKGFEDALDKARLVISMGIDFYPRSPSETTLRLIMDVRDAGVLLSQLQRFREKIVSVAKKNGKTTEIETTKEDDNERNQTGQTT